MALVLLVEFFIVRQLKRRLSKKKGRYYVATSLGLFFLMTSGILLAILLHNTMPHGAWFRHLIALVIFVCFFAKILFVCLLCLEQCYQFFLWALKKARSVLHKKEHHAYLGAKEEAVHGEMSRGEFLAKAGVFSGALPFFLSVYGLGRVHDYKVWQHELSFPNLPAAFDGIKIAQLSDIHAGSFRTKAPIRAGIARTMAAQADVIFFTGDLVNNEAREAAAYFEELSKLKAPMGIYTVLGNHDYGDYKRWGSLALKRKNMQDMLSLQEALGWRLLRNEHSELSLGGERIGILGTENWGKLAFSKKYGDIQKTYRGTENLPFRILLSHDPSHWEGEVVPKYPIDLTLSGHTHGGQLGMETALWRWSPSQYLYKQWAGLYKKDAQYLYVNRGFGYIGLPIRVGIAPEITVIVLKKA